MHGDGTLRKKMNLENEIIIAVIIMYVLLSLAIVLVHLPAARRSGNPDIVTLAHRIARGWRKRKPNALGRAMLRVICSEKEEVRDQERSCGNRWARVLDRFD